MQGPSLKDKSVVGGGKKHAHGLIPLYLSWPLFTVHCSRLCIEVPDHLGVQGEAGACLHAGGEEGGWGCPKGLCVSDPQNPHRSSNHSLSPLESKVASAKEIDSDLLLIRSGPAVW